MVVAIRQLIPAIGIAHGVGGLPLAVFGSVAAHQERIAKLADEGLAGEERSRITAFTKRAHGRHAVAFIAFDGDGAAEPVVEHDLAI